MRRHWSPLREMMQLNARLGRALGDPSVRRWRPRRARPEPVMPPLDVAETADSFIIRVDVPGMKKDDISVVLDEGALAISGEAPLPDPEQAVRRAERFRGPFRRAVPLPRQADPDAIEANLAQGVLTVTVAKRSTDTTRKIGIR